METGGSKGRGCRGKGTGGLKLGWVRLGGGWEEEKSTGSVWTTLIGVEVTSGACVTYVTVGLEPLRGLVRSRICGLSSAVCPLASSVFTDRLIAECGRMAPGVEKG